MFLSSVRPCDYLYATCRAIQAEILSALQLGAMFACVVRRSSVVSAMVVVTWALSHVIRE